MDGCRRERLIAGVVHDLGDPWLCSRIAPSLLSPCGSSRRRLHELADWQQLRESAFEEVPRTAGRATPSPAPRFASGSNGVVAAGGVGLVMGRVDRCHDSRQLSCPDHTPMWWSMQDSRAVAVPGQSERTPTQPNPLDKQRAPSSPTGSETRPAEPSSSVASRARASVSKPSESSTSFGPRR